MIKSIISSLKLGCILVLLGGFLSCVDENSDAKSDKMCPTDGANLYLRCSDGGEKVFAIGYADEPIYIRKEGTWTIKAAEEFCKGKPAEISFYLAHAHFQLSMQNTQGTITRFPLQTEESDCKRFFRNISIEYITIKIKSIQSRNLKPKDNYLEFP